MSEKTKLKPCPFCFNEAKPLVHGFTWVIAHNIKCYLYRHFQEYNTVIERGQFAAWNRRAGKGKP